MRLSFLALKTSPKKTYLQSNKFQGVFWRFQENWRTDSLEVDIKTNKYFMFVLYRERQQAKNGTRTSAGMTVTV